MILRINAHSSHSSFVAWSMSMAEFYIDNCIDPGDPESLEMWMACHARGDESDCGELEDDEEDARSVANEAYHHQAQSVQRDRAAETSAARHWPLSESDLDYSAETRGWEKIECERSDAPMALIRKDGVRLNFWLSTGTVGSYLDHPTQGKTQLFRRDITMCGVAVILDNPRQHTGVGYHTREQLNNRKRSASPEEPKPNKRGLSVCRCGVDAAKACVHHRCGKCCPGPCARHKR